MRKIRYSQDELKGLIENYAVLRELKNNHGIGLNILVRLIDIDRAIYHLPPKEYRAVLLYGQLRTPSRDLEQALEVNRKTVERWYESGLTYMLDYLNEGIE